MLSAFFHPLKVELQWFRFPTELLCEIMLFLLSMLLIYCFCTTLSLIPPPHVFATV